MKQYSFKFKVGERVRHQLNTDTLLVLKCYMDRMEKPVYLVRTRDMSTMEFNEFELVRPGEVKANG